MVYSYLNVKGIFVVLILFKRSFHCTRLKKSTTKNHKKIGLNKQLNIWKNESYVNVFVLHFKSHIKSHINHTSSTNEWNCRAYSQAGHRPNTDLPQHLEAPTTTPRHVGALTPKTKSPCITRQSCIIPYLYHCVKFIVFIFPV